MDSALNEYIQEIDKEFERLTSTKENIERFKNQHVSISHNIYKKYDQLPDKWKTQLSTYVNKKSFSLLKKFWRIKYDNNYNVINAFNPSLHITTSDIIELRATVMTLIDEMETLKSQVVCLVEDNKYLREELASQQKINVIIQNNLNTVQTELRYFKKSTQDPGVPVGIIQRYWRSYVLRRNVKILAKQYEEQMLQEFRKNLVKGVSQNKVHESTNILSSSFLKGVSQSKVCEAAENRKATNTLPKKLKPGPSDPREWTERKANQVASDWMN